MYEKNRDAIKECEVLVIDEIGMISSKMFSEVELLVRTVKGNQSIFGGIQVIGCGSFFQLPPVPSILDKGQFAFESTCFSKVFPHKLVLNAIHRQKEVDFIRAINEVCEGNLSPRTHQLLLQLKKPLAEDMKPLYIFGTNYDVDFFNYMMLDKVNGQEQIFTSDDSGTNLSYKRCGANKYVLLKTGCKVIVTRNLYNGLVNGISATVTKLEENSVKIKVDTDIHLNHAMQGKEFLINKYTFITRNNSNTITSVRKQIPLKLGYAVT